AQQGFASAEPFDYENTFADWGKPVAFQTLHDAGFEVYAATLGIRPEQKDELNDCLKEIVPVFQQSVVSYVNSPKRANDIIVDAVTQFADFWTQSDAITAWSVEQQKELGLVGNGPDDTVGNMVADRIQGVIDSMSAAGMSVPSGLTADDLFTNEYINESIGF
ncbi:MAG: ABC transporter substrate-binding protein, partial [Ilumatobacteraceae bacterium]